MHDPRIETLANLLLDHSCQLKAGEKVLIEAIDLPEPHLVCALVEGAAKRGAIPLVTWKSQEVQRALYRNATARVDASSPAKFEGERMREMQAYIGVRGAAQSAASSPTCRADKMDLYQQHWWAAGA